MPTLPAKAAFGGGQTRGLEWSRAWGLLKPEATCRPLGPLGL